MFSHAVLHCAIASDHRIASLFPLARGQVRGRVRVDGGAVGAGALWGVRVVDVVWGFVGVAVDDGSPYGWDGFAASWACVLLGHR